MYSGLVGANPALRSAPSSSGLYEVLDLILDKGIVIDAYVRVSLVGIEVLTVDARIVIASVDTYLRWAEAADRLVLASDPKTLSDLSVGGKTEKAAEAASDKKDAVKHKSKSFMSRLTGGEDEEEDEEKDKEEKSGSRRRSRSKRK